MVEITEDLDKLCTVMDKLTLDALTLMEEEIRLKLNVENAMGGGETHLAKARYIMGQNSVSSLQLPSKNSSEFSAAAVLHENKDDKLFGENSYKLRLIKKSEDETVHNPLRWFGVLIPQNLTFAQNLYRQALQWAVQAVNVQTQLRETFIKIEQLKSLKAAFVSK